MNQTEQFNCPLCLDKGCIMYDMVLEGYDEPETLVYACPKCLAGEIQAGFKRMSEDGYLVDTMRPRDMPNYKLFHTGLMEFGIIEEANIREHMGKTRFEVEVVHIKRKKF